MFMDRPVRVLHELHWLMSGGIENWLLALLKRFNGDEVRFDFILSSESPNDIVATSRGAKIHYVSKPKNLFAYARDVKGIIETGNYDVVHSHRPETANILVKAAKDRSIPCRIVQGHSTKLARGEESLLNKMRLARYRLCVMPSVRKHATHLSGCSIDAGRWFFGDGFTNDPKAKVLYCGIPLDHYGTDGNPGIRAKYLEEYSLPSDAIVIGNVGALDIAKNQSFLLDIFHELSRRNQCCVLFIAGDGPLREMLESKVRLLGLQDKVRMPGKCTNIPRMACRLFDAFCFPSVYEGLGLALIEAAAAGLHSVCSDAITNDVLSVFRNQITPLNLKSPASDWADALEKAIASRRSPEIGVQTVRESPFSIENSAADLLEFYRQNIKNTVCYPRRSA